MSSSASLSVPSAAHPLAASRERHGMWLMVAGGLMLGTLGIFLEEAGQSPLTAVWFRCAFGLLALTAWFSARTTVYTLTNKRVVIALQYIHGIGKKFAQEIVDKVGKARRRDVKTGTVSDSGIAILSGLDGSERVVVRSGGFLSPGETVNPKLVRQ